MTWCQAPSEYLLETNLVGNQHCFRLDDLGSQVFTFDKLNVAEFVMRMPGNLPNVPLLGVDLHTSEFVLSFSLTGRLVCRLSLMLRGGSPVMGTLSVRVLGSGEALPRRIVPTAEVAALCGISAEEAIQRTGIHHRHWISADEDPLAQGALAAERAIEDAGLILRISTWCSMPREVPCRPSPTEVHSSLASWG